MTTLGNGALVAMLIEVTAISVFLATATGFVSRRLMRRSSPSAIIADILIAAATCVGCYAFMVLAFIFTRGRLGPVLDRLTSYAPLAAMFGPAVIVAFMWAIRARGYNTSERAR